MHKSIELQNDTTEFFQRLLERLETEGTHVTHFTIALLIQKYKYRRKTASEVSVSTLKSVQRYLRARKRNE